MLDTEGTDLVVLPAPQGGQHILAVKAQGGRLIHQLLVYEGGGRCCICLDDCQVARQVQGEPGMLPAGDDESHCWQHHARYGFMQIVQ